MSEARTAYRTVDLDEVFAWWATQSDEERQETIRRVRREMGVETGDEERFVLVVRTRAAYRNRSRAAERQEGWRDDEV